MTVQELIAELQSYPPDALIMKHSERGSYPRFEHIKKPATMVTLLKGVEPEITIAQITQVEKFPDGGFVWIRL